LITVLQLSPAATTKALFSSIFLASEHLCLCCSKHCSLLSTVLQLSPVATTNALFFSVFIASLCCGSGRTQANILSSRFRLREHLCLCFLRHCSLLITVLQPSPVLTITHPSLHLFLACLCWDSCRTQQHILSSRFFLREHLCLCCSRHCRLLSTVLQPSSVASTNALFSVVYLASFSRGSC